MTTIIIDEEITLPNYHVATLEDAIDLLAYVKNKTSKPQGSLYTDSEEYKSLERGTWMTAEETIRDLKHMAQSHDN